MLYKHIVTLISKNFNVKLFMFPAMFRQMCLHQDSHCEPDVSVVKYTQIKP